jgi:acid phosphatase family membrane protein YuiD
VGDFLKEVAVNHIIWTTMTAWFLAQFLKVFFYYFKEKRISLRRFVGAGGMPSSHTALVFALATAIGIQEGWETPVTAIAIIFALVVMYDAAGVRLAAGRQAATLNKMIDELFEEGEFHQERLKELIGHTPVEVFAGAALGIITAVVLM